MSHALKILDWILSGLGLAFSAWLFYRAVKRSESPLKLIIKGFITIVLLAVGIFIIHETTGSLHAGGILSNAPPVFLIVILVAAGGVILSIIWTPHIGDLLASPLTDLFDGGAQPPERRPVYSIAISKRRQNKPLEAIIAIREQLAQFPDDFEGVLLLASIQALDTQDLPSAEMTIHHFCNSPGVTDREVVKALTRLAEWHLEAESDPDVVIEIMERLMTQFPDAKISRRIAERLGRVKTGEEKRKALRSVKSEISSEATDGKYISNFRANRRS